jgi:hypothetical protein
MDQRTMRSPQLLTIRAKVLSVTPTHGAEEAKSEML